MKLIAAAALISVGASSATAETVTLDFYGEYADLPYSEKGLVTTGYGAVVEDGLAAEAFFEDRALSVTLNEGVFSLSSLVIDRRLSVQNRFSLVGFLNGAQVWSSGPFNFETQEGQGLLSIDGFQTSFVDELLILGFGSKAGDPQFTNFVHFDSFSFDVLRELPPAPVPLPAGFMLLASALAGLSLRRVL